MKATLLSIVLLLLVATSAAALAAPAPAPAIAPQRQQSKSEPSKYDEDGHTIFTGKSGWYMVGYRDGVLQADSDIKTKFNTTGIDATQADIQCPPDTNAEYCLGYKDGYSGEAMDQLE